ncbi:hypothetical protein HK100_007576, partial [Physocladia obscura]
MKLNIARTCNAQFTEISKSFADIKLIANNPRRLRWDDLVNSYDELDILKFLPPSYWLACDDQLFKSLHRMVWMWNFDNDYRTGNVKQKAIIAASSHSVETLRFRYENPLEDWMQKPENISQLKSIWIEYLSGVNRLPPFWHSKKLRSLTLEFNYGMIGSIPPKISELLYLTSLNLSCSGGITFENPRALFEMDLMYLNLQSINLSCIELSEFWVMKRLRSLNLAWCGVFGPIGPGIAELVSLNELNLSNNPSIGGSIPVEIWSLVHLNSLNLSFTGLSGVIPKGVGTLWQLNICNLEGNTLSGSIPKDFGRCQGLKSLSLQNNRFDGHIPTEILMLKNLKQLKLANNSFVGFCGGTISLNVENSAPLKAGSLSPLSDAKRNMLNIDQILVDTERKTLSRLDPSARRTIVNADSTGRGNNWTHGYSDDVGAEAAMEAIRRNLERSETDVGSRGTLIFQSIAGGTGSGLGSRLTEDIRDVYPKRYIWNCAISPFTSGETALQHYNSTLSIARLQEHSDMISIFSNDLLLNAISKQHILRK